MTHHKITLSHRPELDGDAEPVPMLTEEELVDLRGLVERHAGALTQDILRLLSEHAAFKARALAAERALEAARVEVSGKVIEALSTDEDCQATKAGKYHVAIYVLRRVDATLRSYAEQPVAIQEVE